MNKWIVLWIAIALVAFFAIDGGRTFFWACAYNTPYSAEATPKQFRYNIPGVTK